MQSVNLFFSRFLDNEVGMIKPVITYKELVALSLRKKTRNYYEGLRRFRRCFSGDIKKDVASANRIIDSIVNNNTAHSIVSLFKWALNNFYGLKFNPKYIHARPGEISKLTTRLSIEDVKLIRQKYQEWIFEPINNGVPNYVKAVREGRMKYYMVFETLLTSGMRIGELAAIPFLRFPCHRIVQSKITSNIKCAEIIINTEKTCKQREVYVPIEAYEFFTKCSKGLKANLIKDNFKSFREWAKLPFRLTAHVLRRTTASVMHEHGVDLYTIAMVLGNTPRTLMNHYIISSARNFDAVDLANCATHGYIQKINNLYWNQTYLSRKN